MLLSLRILLSITVTLGLRLVNGILPVLELPVPLVGPAPPPNRLTGPQKV